MGWNVDWFKDDRTMIKCITLVFVFLVRKKTGKKNVDGFSITSCSRSLFSKSSSSIVEDRIWLFMTSISTWNLNSTFPSFFAWRNVSLDSLFYHSYILLASSSQDKYHVYSYNHAINSWISFLRQFIFRQKPSQIPFLILINQ